MTALFESYICTSCYKIALSLSVWVPDFRSENPCRCETCCGFYQELRREPAVGNMALLWFKKFQSQLDRYLVLAETPSGVASKTVESLYLTPGRLRPRNRLAH
jgi:hypothetical protein